MISLLTTLNPAEKRKWPELLPELVFCYNATPHSTTGLSPYRLLFGREPRLPLDTYLSVPSAPPATAAADYLQRHLDRVAELRQRTSERLQRHPDVDPPTKTRETAVAPGDQVLTRTHHTGRCKLKDKYNDTPAEIVAVPVPSGGYFKIRYPDGREQTISGANLRRFQEPLSAPAETPEVQVPNV